MLELRRTGKSFVMNRRPAKRARAIISGYNSRRFPLAIWDRPSLQDGELSVALKAADGSIDQAAGIVWRFQDANHGYIVRANALENNVVLYKIEHSVRTSIARKRMPSRSYGAKHTIRRGRRNHLKLGFAPFTVVPKEAQR